MGMLDWLLDQQESPNARYRPDHTDGNESDEDLLRRDILAMQRRTNAEAKQRFDNMMRLWRQSIKQGEGILDGMEGGQMDAIAGLSGTDAFRDIAKLGLSGDFSAALRGVQDRERSRLADQMNSMRGQVAEGYTGMAQGSMALQPNYSVNNTGLASGLAQAQAQNLPFYATPGFGNLAGQVGQYLGNRFQGMFRPPQPTMGQLGNMLPGMIASAL